MKNKRKDGMRKPIALFLQIPNKKETSHTLASMLILQAYKELVYKANAYDDLSLPKPIYFILDEFGNLPKIHKLEQMITVGRSRNIWMNLVVQSYSQLAKVYDEKSADIIKSNCNIQVFIGTTDLKTIEDFSKRCGNYSIIQRNVGFNSSKGEDIAQNLKNGMILFSDYPKVWLNREKKDLRPTTITGYHYNIYNVIGPYFQKKRIFLQDISPEDLEEFYAHEIETKNNNTVIRYHANIRKAIKYAFKKGFIMNNQTDRANRPKLATSFTTTTTKMRLTLYLIKPKEQLLSFISLWRLIMD